MQKGCPFVLINVILPYLDILALKDKVFNVHKWHLSHSFTMVRRSFREHDVLSGIIGKPFAKEWPAQHSTVHSTQYSTVNGSYSSGSLPLFTTWKYRVQFLRFKSLSKCSLPEVCYNSTHEYNVTLRESKMSWVEVVEKWSNNRVLLWQC